MSVEIRHQMVALLPRLRSFARALAHAPDAADDLVQATCEKALRGLDSWTPGTRLDSWMFRIMQNQWIDTKRRARPQVPFDEPSIEAQLPAEDRRRSADARLMLEDIRMIIPRLPEEQRAVLTLVCAEDVSYRDAAVILDIPLGTVMSRLARARRTLAEALDGTLELPRASGERS